MEKKNNPQIFIFKIENILFGVKVDEIVEVVRPGEIIPEKKPKNFILGTFSLRNQKIPVFDLPSYLGLKKTNAKNNIIVSKIKDLILGFLVDEFRGVANEPEKKMVLDKDIFKIKSPVPVCHIDGQLIQIISFVNLLPPSKINSLKKIKL